MNRIAIKLFFLILSLMCLNQISQAQQKSYTWIYSNDKTKTTTDSDKTTPKSAEVLNAEKAIDEGKYEDAVRITNDIIKSDPNNVWAYFDRAVANLLLNRLIAAHSDTDTLFSLMPPNHPLPFVVRANIYLNQEKYDEAISDATKAIQFSVNCSTFCPTLSLSYYNRGLFYNKKKDLSAGLSDFNKAIELDPNYDEAYIERAYSHIYLDKNYQAAVVDASAAISISPKSADAFDTRGFAYLYLSEWEKAASDYTKAMTLGKNKTTTYYNRGYAFEQLKQIEAAINDYRQALKIDPKNLEAQKSLDLLTKK